MKAKTSQPTFCRPEAYDLFVSSLDHLDRSSESLMMASVAIAMHQLEDAQPISVENRIHQIAEAIIDRVQIPTRKALITHMHALMFDEMRFRGDDRDHYNPLNSYLPTVLESRRGAPITLSLVYRLVADRIGLRVDGVNTPGHFLASLELDGSLIYVDAFQGGRLVNLEEVSSIVRGTTGQLVTSAAQALRPASNHDWIVRSLQNLQNIFIRTGRINDFGAMLELREALTSRQAQPPRTRG